jgi:hypothetical protein
MKHSTIFKTERLFSMPSTGPNWMPIVLKKLAFWRPLYCLVWKFACPNWCCVVLSFKKNLECWFWCLNVFQRFFRGEFELDSYKFSTLWFRSGTFFQMEGLTCVWVWFENQVCFHEHILTHFSMLKIVWVQNFPQNFQNRGSIYVQSPTTN